MMVVDRTRATSVVSLDTPGSLNTVWSFAVREKNYTFHEGIVGLCQLLCPNFMLASKGHIVRPISSAITPEDCVASSYTWSPCPTTPYTRTLRKLDA